MSELFNDYLIDTENGEVYKRLFKNTDCDGYHIGGAHDVYGNLYHGRHEVIIAEGLGLPKHKWPVDEFGRRYVVDHITPISNGGSDGLSNLRLVPFRDNVAKNEMTIVNFKNRKLNNPLAIVDDDGTIIKQYNSRKEIESDGFNYNTVRRAATRGNKTSGNKTSGKLRFKYI